MALLLIILYFCVLFLSKIYCTYVLIYLLNIQEIKSDFQYHSPKDVLETTFVNCFANLGY